MKTETPPWMTEEVKKAGYTKNILEHLSGARKAKNVTLPEIKVAFEYKGSDFLKDPLFLKKFKFLKKLTSKNFSSARNQEAKIFLQALSYETYELYWKMIPVETAIENTKSIILLKEILTKRPQLKTKVFSAAQVLMRNELAGNYDVRGMKTDLIAYWKLVHGAEGYRAHAEALIDVFLLKEHDEALAFHEAGIRVDELRLSSIITKMKTDPEFKSGFEHHGLFCEIKELFTIFHGDKKFIDFLIEYFSVTDNADKKGEKILGEMVSIIKEAKASSAELLALRRLWLPLLVAISKYSDKVIIDSDYYLNNLLPFGFYEGADKEELVKAAHEIALNIQEKYEREHHVASASRIKILMSILQRTAHRHDLQTRVIKQISEIGKKSSPSIIWEVTQNYEVLEKRSELLDLGLANIEHSVDNIFHVSTFLDLLAQESRPRHEKAVKLVQQHLFPVWVKKNPGDTLTKMVVKHFPIS